MADNPFRHIMVATDLDETSAMTMQYAGVLAERFHSRTTVLYAEQLFFDRDEMPLGAQLGTDQELSGAERTVRDYASQFLPASVAIDAAVVPKHPAAVILNAVREHDPDLLIIGTHGRQGRRRMWGPPVAESIVRRVDRPVLVVPPRRAVAAPRPSPGITRIVCPVNFSDVALEALEFAAMLTEAFLAELTIVHVIENALPESDEEVRRRLFGWMAPGMTDRCVCRQVLARGAAAEKIVDAVEDYGADLLVIGAQQSQFRGESVVGTTTERLVRLARFPILTVARKPAVLEAAVTEEEPELVSV